MAQRIRGTVAAALVALALTACTTPDEASSSSPTTETSATEGTTTPTPGGVVTPVDDLLDWTPVPGPVGTTVTASNTWSVSVDTHGRSARIDGPQPQVVRAGQRGRISEVLLDEERAVVVVEDTLAERGDRATIIDLASGGTATLDGSSSPPTTTGGTWAMGQDSLVHASVSPEGAYCLATVSLESGQGSVGWCAEPRHGFRGAVITPAGLSVMSFDDTRPVSCAELLAVEGDTASAFGGVAECRGWDAALLDGGAIWSEVPQPNRSEKAQLHARVGDTSYHLGPGTTGGLVWCGSAAYFVRDPQTRTDPARLMRFTADGTLAVVYESASTGNAFLSIPRCGGDRITITSLGEQGDEQVGASVS